MEIKKKQGGIISCKIPFSMYKKNKYLLVSTSVSRHVQMCVDRTSHYTPLPLKAGTLKMLIYDGITLEKISKLILDILFQALRVGNIMTTQTTNY